MKLIPSISKALALLLIGAGMLSSYSNCRGVGNTSVESEGMQIKSRMTDRNVAIAGIIKKSIN